MLWEGKDPDVLNLTYNLVQVKFDFKCFFHVKLPGLPPIVSNVSLERIFLLLYVKGLCHFLSADCSGNGVAVAVGDCGSRCICSVRWTGTCCQIRRPWRNWGDPHLETLDGRPVLPIRQRNKLT